MSALEQRARQSLKIRQWQPWNKSTGPKTQEGKALSSQNAYKGGLRERLRRLARLLRDHREVLKLIG
ncbi:MAG: hypothetical protein ACXW1Z_21775 [Methylobacter sp.]